MVGKLLKFAYGIKLIATWMIIPFILSLVPGLWNEFTTQYSTQEVTLVKESYSGYPDVYLAFDAEAGGKNYVGVHTPVTSKVGDTVTVVLRNGKYYLTPEDEATMNAYMTVPGRFLRITNNFLGYHVAGFAAALLISFILTFKKRKEIRSLRPILSKVTDIAGIVFSAGMSFALIYGVTAETLTALGIALIGMGAGIVYTAVFTFAWLVESALADS
ncbi:MAG: hypothetical protein J5715_03250 [Clostridiales bacterium]|nr:hypothetical protein [Clostridiales bacterium]